MAVKDNKFLTFMLGEEEYAIPIEKTREIIGMMPITKAPNLPDFLKGLINLRGKIIPVIDLRLKFGLDYLEYGRKTSIIISEIQTDKGSKISGIIVDEVHEVIELNDNSIDEPPKFGLDFDQDFLKAIGRKDDRTLMILDVNNILSIDERNRLQTQS